jgi:prophage antirepressor-like protein
VSVKSIGFFIKILFKMTDKRISQVTNLQKVFTFNGTIDVQVVMINGEPHFVVADVCHVLTLTNSTKAMYGLDDDEYLTLPVVRAGQQRTVNVVNESGLYALIFQSRKPIAKQFRRWVTSEVIPAIRKTGSYTAPSAPQPAPAEDLAYSMLKQLYEFKCEQCKHLKERVEYYKGVSDRRMGIMIEMLK